VEQLPDVCERQRDSCGRVSGTDVVVRQCHCNGITMFCGVTKTVSTCFRMDAHIHRLLMAFSVR